MQQRLHSLHWFWSQQFFLTNTSGGFSSVHVRHGIKVDAAPPAESSCFLLVPLVAIASEGRAKGGHLLGHSREFGEITLCYCARFTKKCVMANAARLLALLGAPLGAAATTATRATLQVVLNQHLQSAVRYQAQVL